VNDAATVEEVPVTLPVAGEKVVGTLSRPDIPLPAFLFVHGWGADRSEDEAPAEELARLGCLCFTFDMRGHADSDAAQAEVTRQDGLEDVLAAYDHLAAQPLVDRSAIGVVGTSYGGYLALLLTAHRPVRWLGLRVPALYPDKAWNRPKAALDKDAVRTYRQQPHDGDDRALRACDAFAGDVLLVESEKDEQIPREAILSLQAAFCRSNSFTRRILRGASHAMRDPGHQRRYNALLAGWVDEMVRDARSAGD
jgi:hypothetical protein